MGETLWFRLGLSRDEVSNPVWQQYLCGLDIDDSDPPPTQTNDAPRDGVGPQPALWGRSSLSLIDKLYCKLSPSSSRRPAHNLRAASVA